MAFGLLLDRRQVLVEQDQQVGGALGDWRGVIYPFDVAEDQLLDDVFWEGAI